MCIRNIRHVLTLCLLFLAVFTILGAAQAQDNVTYFVSPTGSDQCSGTSQNANARPSSDACAFATIARALESARPGDTIAILPGIYREAIRPPTSGSPGRPITIKAQNGPGTVFFYGSVSTADRTWQPYAAYAQAGGQLSLQPGVDTGQIFSIDLDWCYTDPGGGGARTFYENCADVPAGQLAIPYETDLVALVAGEGTADRTVTRLPKAKEPDWEVDAPWRVSENWWKADSGAASLDDAAAGPRDTSPQFLKDTLDDNTLDEDLDGRPDFPNIPPGNIQSTFAAGDFADPREARTPDPGAYDRAYAGVPRKVSLGATIVFNDARDGHYTNNMFIRGYNPETGIIEVQDAYNVEGFDKMGYLTKFYVEGTPKAMDCPGEWVHHDGRLFILTGTGCGRTVTQADLQSLEIGQRFEILNVQSISHLVIQDLTFAFGTTLRSGIPLYQEAWDGGPPLHIAQPPMFLSLTASPAVNSGALQEVLLDGVAVEHAITGISISGAPAAPVASSLTIQNGRFEHIDDRALRFNDGVFEPFAVENNVFRDVGFHPVSEDGDGLFVSKVSNFIFRGNLVQNIGHNGLQVLQTPNDPNYVSTDILIESNTFDGACQMATDCGGLKFHGFGNPFGYLMSVSETQRLNRVLVVNNVAKNNLGWTYARWRRDLAQSHPQVGEGTSLRVTLLGLMANGFYLDFASGVTFAGNTLLNNGRAAIFMNTIYRDGEIHIFDNVIHNALVGVYFFPGEQLAQTPNAELHSLEHTDTQIIGNVFSKIETAAIYLSCSAGDELDANGRLAVNNVTIDANVYDRYLTNPRPNPYWWFEPSDYAPVNLHYDGCGGQAADYADVAAIQAATPWEAAGVEWDNNTPLYANPDGANAADFALADAGLAARQAEVSEVPELTGVVDALEAQLDVQIGDDGGPVLAATPGAVVAPPTTAPATPANPLVAATAAPTRLPGAGDTLPGDPNEDGDVITPATPPPDTAPGDQAPVRRPLRRIAIGVVLLLLVLTLLAGARRRQRHKG